MAESIFLSAHMLQMMSCVKQLEKRALGLNQCTIAAGGAAPMPPELLRWYERLGLPIIVVYGMTENCGVSHATLPGVQRPGTVGQAYEGVQSRLCPQTGEIQVKSPGLMLGYYKEPELTRDTFTEDGWLHTGDKGQLDAEGNLRLTGRLKEIFKTSKGKYVAPAPIENRLAEHSRIEQVCVVGDGLIAPLGLCVLSAVGQQDASGTARAGLHSSLEKLLEEVNGVLDKHERLRRLVSHNNTPQHGYKSKQGKWYLIYRASSTYNVHKNMLAT